MAKSKVKELTKAEQKLLSKELRIIESSSKLGECQVFFKVNKKTISINIEYASGAENDKFKLDRETMERVYGKEPTHKDFWKYH
jgi:hypothetical protein